MRFRPLMFLPAVALALVACGGDSSNTGTNPTSPTNPTDPTPPTETSQVTITDNVFTPANIKVPANTDVKWTWAQSASTHNVTLSDGSASGDKTGGASFSKNFSTAGTFDYRCTIHPGMGGTVAVTQ